MMLGVGFNFVPALMVLTQYKLPLFEGLFPVSSLFGANWPLNIGCH